MLQFKIIPHILQKGHTQPFKYLMKNLGFGRGKAAKFSNDTQQSISLKDLSRLCERLHCTPNDLFYWEQKSGNTLLDTHPCMVQLHPPDKHANWLEAAKHLSSADKEEVYQLLQAKLKGKEE